MRSGEQFLGDEEIAENAEQDRDTGVLKDDTDARKAVTRFTETTQLAIFQSVYLVNCLGAGPRFVVASGSPWRNILSYIVGRITRIITYLSISYIYQSKCRSSFHNLIRKKGQPSSVIPAEAGIQPQPEVPANPGFPPSRE